MKILIDSFRSRGRLFSLSKIEFLLEFKGNNGELARAFNERFRARLSPDIIAVAARAAKQKQARAERKNIRMSQRS